MTIWGTQKRLATCAWDGVWYIYDANGVYTGRTAETRIEAARLVGRA